MKKITSVVTMLAFLSVSVFMFTSALYADDKYTVSGFVTDKSGIGIQDADIKVSGDISLARKTDSTGYYRFDDIANGAKIEISASKAGLSLSPAVFKINEINSNRTVNFRAAQSAGSADAGNVPTIPKPVTGVTQAQPEYVRETKSFFSSEDQQPAKQTVSSPKASYELNGKVTYYAAGLVGVRIMINNDRRLSTMTDVNGYYSIKGLKPGSEIIVSFSKDGYEFNPSEYSIITRDEDITIDVSALASLYKISGVVSESKRGIEGVSIKVTDGVDEYAVETDDRGYYEISGLPHGRNFLVTANKEGVVLTPLKSVISKLDGNRSVHFNGVVRKFNISGKVSDAEGKAIKYSSVFLKTNYDTHKVITNSKGAYLFDNMPSDLSYSVTAQKDGYKDSDASVIAELQKDVTLDFKLIKIEDEITTEKMMPEEGDASVSEAKSSVPAKGKRKEASPKRKAAKKAAAEPVLAKASDSVPDEVQAAVPVAREKAVKEKAKDKDKDKAKTKPPKQQSKSKKEEEPFSKSIVPTSPAEAPVSANVQEAPKAESKVEPKGALKAEAKAAPAPKEAVKNKQMAKQQAEEKKEEKKERKKEDKKEEKAAAPAEVKAPKKEKEQAVQQKDKTKYVKIRGYVGTKTIPIANINLTLEPGGHKAVTDAKGRYSFDSVPENPRYLLKPHTADFNTEPSESILNDVSSNITQDFAANVWLEGEVLAEGKPVSNAVIQLNGVQAATTNNFGKFRIEKVEYGIPVTVSAVKAGYTFYPPSEDIPNITANNDDFNFYVAFSIAGRVTIQGSGLGLGNIDVEISGSTNTVISTDYGGNFLIQGLEQGGNFTITPKAGGYAFHPPSREFSALKSNFVSQNFAAIKETYTIKGNVNFGRKPVKNAIISITKRALKYFTDENGNFEIASLDYGGPYILTVESRDYQFEPIVIDVLKENITVDFSNDISLGGRIMSGETPLANITVDVNGKKEKTDADGRYIIKGLRYDGDYLLTVSAPGMMFVPAQKEYKQVKKSMLSENIEGSLVVSGRITLDNKGLEDVTVIVSGDSETYQTDANGYYFISNLKYGKDYAVEIVSPGYKFDPPKREYQKIVKARMSENYQATPIGHTIKGTVTAEGRSLKRVPVLLEGASKKQALTNDEGEFVFEGLAPAKRYKLSVFSKIYKFESPSGIIDNLEGDTVINLEYGKVVVPSSVTAPRSEEILDIEKDQAKQITFTVTGKVTAAGEPLQNAVIASRLGEALTNENGEYTVSVQSGESIKIEPSLSGYVFAPQNAVLNDIKGDRKNIDFTAEMKLHRLTGYVVNNALKGVKGVEISDLNSGAIFITNVKGFYDMPDINHKEKNIIVPESERYNFFPEMLEVSLENDAEAQDIYAYPKKIKRAEAFVYGGTQGRIEIEKNVLSIVMISPEEGRVSVTITDAAGNAVKEFLTDISADLVASIDWDGVTSFGNLTDPGEHYVIIDGAGFKEETVKFEIIIP